MPGCTETNNFFPVLKGKSKIMSFALKNISKLVRYIMLLSRFCTVNIFKCDCFVGCNRSLLEAQYYDLNHTEKHEVPLKGSSQH